MDDFYLGDRSIERLQGVHPHLIDVVKHAIILTKVDFTVVEGVRSHDRQAHLVANKTSRTMNSRHLTGHAVDLAPLIDGVIPWEKIETFKYLAKVMFRAAHVCGHVIEWGGHFGEIKEGEWEAFFDGPHFQLPWDFYPVEKDQAA